MIFSIMLKSLYIVLFLAGGPPDSHLPPQIIRNAETLSRFKTIYVKFASSTSSADHKEPRKTNVEECWKVGNRVRTNDRMFWVFGPDGPKSLGANGRLTMTSLSDKELRSIDGFDPDHPIQLDYARDAGQWGRVKCMLTPRDPGREPVSEWTLFGLELVPGKSLAEVAALAQITELQSPSPHETALRIDKAETPALNGVVVVLDNAHGSMIRRVEWNKDEVLEIEESSDAGEGLWFPVRIKGTHGTGEHKEVDTINVLDFKINSPISDDVLEVRFPEGARVVDPVRGINYIWGADGPQKSFTSIDSMMKFLYEHARQVQGQPGVVGFNELKPRSFWQKPLLWINVAGFVVIFILFTVRRRLSKGKE